MCGSSGSDRSRALRFSARSSSGFGSCVQLQIIAHEISSPLRAQPKKKSIPRCQPTRFSTLQQQWRTEAIHEVVAVFEVVIEEEDRLVLVEEVEVRINFPSQSRSRGRGLHTRN